MNTVTINPGMKFTSRSIDALVQASKITYSKAIKPANNKYGWVEVIHCNGYVFKSSKAFGLYLLDLINALDGCGIIDYAPIKAAHMAGSRTITFFTIQ
jgi:hypothetical protein